MKQSIFVIAGSEEQQSPGSPPQNRGLTLGSLFVAALFCMGAAQAESVASKVKQGNLRYDQKMYDQALQHYSEALAPDSNRTEIRYNLGNTLYRQGKFPEAATELRKAAGSTDPALQAKAHYNLGNALFRANDFQGALSEYTAALKIDSRDPDAKHNLELALRKLEEQKQPQKKDSKDQNKSDKDKQDDSKQEKNKSSADSKQKEPPQKDSGEKQDPQKSQPSPPSPGEEKQLNPPQQGQGKMMDPKEAERLLQAMEAKERQEQLHQLQLLRRQKSREKDW
jgi:Ca-activated chloride channel homolog